MLQFDWLPNSYIQERREFEVRSNSVALFHECGVLLSQNRIVEESNRREIHLRLAVEKGKGNIWPIFGPHNVPRMLSKGFLDTEVDVFRDNIDEYPVFSFVYISLSFSVL